MAYHSLSPTHPRTLELTPDLARAIDELDRLLHRLKEMGRGATPVSARNGWEMGQGLWKGHITQDPLAYQRRIRGEEEV